MKLFLLILSCIFTFTAAAQRPGATIVVSTKLFANSPMYDSLTDSDKVLKSIQGMGLSHELIDLKAKIESSSVPNLLKKLSLIQGKPVLVDFRFHHYREMISCLVTDEFGVGYILTKNGHRDLSYHQAAQEFNDEISKKLENYLKKRIKTEESRKEKAISDKSLKEEKVLRVNLDEKSLLDVFNFFSVLNDPKLCELH